MVDSGGSAWEGEPTEVRRFVWSGWLMLLELDGSDDVIRKYTWGLDLAGQHGGVNSLESAGGIGGLLAMEAPQTVGDPLKYVYLYDANGNVGQLVDLAAATVTAGLVAKYEYDPYGAVVAQSGDYAATNPFRFSTKYWDDETGLGYWGYRYYDPRTGRWTSHDPLEERGGIHLYSFALNSPTALIDELGHQASQPAKKTACCRYRRSLIQKSLSGEVDWYGRPLGCNEVSQKHQRTETCSSDTESPEACCRCPKDVDLGTSGSLQINRRITWEFLEADWGPCCFCKISAVRDPNWPDWPWHMGLVIECPGKNARRVDFRMRKCVAGIAIGSVIGLSPAVPATTDTLQHKVIRQMEVDCETAEAVWQRANDDEQNPPGYNLIHDCHWYTRVLEKIAGDGYLAFPAGERPPSECP
ncbi:MAG: RHS repeat-associated core domain-containing protein [Phycisphaerae bacterium]|jgi:RHS repeat-associated protein